MKDPLTEITWDFLERPISFTDLTWLSGIPAAPGWYLIATDAPLEVLAAAPPPPSPGRHYDIAGRVAACAELLRRDLAIRSEPGALTVVYSGQAKNLQSRAREHVRGHLKTACLGLQNYPSLHSYRWAYRYSRYVEVDGAPTDDAALRILAEQVWRAKHGWPVLCRA